MGSLRLGKIAFNLMSWFSIHEPILLVWNTSTNSMCGCWSGFFITPIASGTLISLVLTCLGWLEITLKMFITLM